MDLARLDSRIEYVRQPINPKYQNFGFFIAPAETEFLCGQLAMIIGIQILRIAASLN
ncbi:MAG: hypothetical protein IPJ49_29420 [Candidatus Obscuribacter sp.]|nr:hypothetical protein [Candidatus Obscuribacter sp.]